LHKSSYRFVHLSDIHFGQEKNGTLVIHEDARDKLVEDCETFAAENGPADGILVNGDTAYAGEHDQYEAAANWLTRVAKAAGCERFAVRIIPGNHDIDRAKINPFCKTAHAMLRAASKADLNGLLEEHLAVEEEGNPLLPKLAAYREFASRFDCDFPSLKAPCWHKNYALSPQFRFQLLGMSSVQVSDKYDKRGNMILGNNQYVIEEIPNTVPVALIHHPLAWFKDGEDAEPMLYRASILLFGHEHKLAFELRKNQYEQIQARIYAGATNPPEGTAEYPFRYNWIDFALAGTPEKRCIRMSLWPRVWSKGRTTYIPDTETLGERKFIAEDIPCPKFQPEVTASVRTESPGASNSGAQAEAIAMQAIDPSFERLKYFFWTYLDWQERLKALASLDILPKTTTQPLPQTLEHLALRAAQQKGRMKELWDVTMGFVPPNEQLPNPYDHVSKEDKHA
jgi:Calcineurin-like phosphoesterase/GTPase-associated adaptor domain